MIDVMGVEDTMISVDVASFIRIPETLPLICITFTSITNELRLTKEAIFLNFSFL